MTRPISIRLSRNPAAREVMPARCLTASSRLITSVSQRPLVSAQPARITGRLGKITQGDEADDHRGDAFQYEYPLPPRRSPKPPRSSMMPVDNGPAMIAPIADTDINPDEATPRLLSGTHVPR